MISTVAKINTGESFERGIHHMSHAMDMSYNALVTYPHSAYAFIVVTWYALLFPVFLFCFHVFNYVEINIK